MKNLTPEQAYLKLKNCLLEGQKNVFNMDKSSLVKINIRANKDIAPSLFKSDPLLPGEWMAHPTTIRAVRKEVFMEGMILLNLKFPTNVVAANIN